MSIWAASTPTALCCGRLCQNCYGNGGEPRSQASEVVLGSGSLSVDHIGLGNMGLMLICLGAYHFSM